jgi:23S rRNA pseudouridine1911/1915/1917 synthase
MSLPPLNVLYEDNHLLAVVKPAGLPTMGVAADKPSLLEVARQYIKERYQKPGNVYLGVVSRLDAPVTGVVLFARTSKAAARLTEQFRTRTVEKTYWAVVEGAIQPAEADCLDWLVHDDRHRRMHVTAAGTAGSQEARLHYRRLAARAGLSLVEVDLQTGRKHQIRLQLAHRGWPVLGDYKYGSRRKFPAGIALHARRLVVAHPVKGEPLELLAPPPDAWRRLGLVLPQ